jgi:hypothetical protein
MYRKLTECLYACKQFVCYFFIHDFPDSHPATARPDRASPHSGDLAAPRASSRNVNGSKVADAEGGLIAAADDVC